MEPHIQKNSAAICSCHIALMWMLPIFLNLSTKKLMATTFFSLNTYWQSCHWRHCSLQMSCGNWKYYSSLSFLL